MDLLSFAELRKANVARCEGSFHPLKEWSPSDWGNALAGEVGEACNKIKKLRRGENIPVREVADELADVAAYLDLLAARFGIDLGLAVRRKFNEVSERVGSEIELFPSPLSDLQTAFASIAERDYHLKLMRLLLDRNRKALAQVKEYVDEGVKAGKTGNQYGTLKALDDAAADIDENDGLPNCVTCRHAGEICGPHRRKTKDEVVRKHLIDGEFQSDKYLWCKRGFVPLKITDPNARKVLWEYAELRRDTDSEFADDLLEAIRIEMGKKEVSA